MAGNPPLFKSQCKNFTKIVNNINPNSVNAGSGRGVVGLIPYVLFISFFEYLWKKLTKNNNETNNTNSDFYSTIYFSHLACDCVCTGDCSFSVIFSNRELKTIYYK